MHKKIALIVCVALGIPAAGHALTFDVRGGYRAGSHSYESRYKVSQGWQNGWWASMEMDNKNNKNNHQGKNGTDKTDASHSFGDSTVDYNEIEVNYSWPFAEKWALQPGGIYHWSSKGTQLRPYFRINYKATPDLTFGLRYRYDYNTYETVNSVGESHRDSVNRRIYMLIINLMPNGVPCIKARSIDMSTMTINIIMINLRRQKTP
ncbi:putative N-acetylneuraminic acid outer membrane channel protein NanC [Klebsiella pneumoniae]|uniref:oligogalacturonate-specific porin KdgM family protein n=1 Tax=Klebsiella pneumoniae TaxID=573 RepID=UPI000F215353|nr:oligogalacturonate-specific porin KdgM family protein [Klebsiella pneumoniae]VCX55952.1 putative N-acetylneuraminic acid outer membrane channel protein NanC [Klebsiella pneumoniae]